eukprot:tig00021795_g23527.t1
MPYADLPAPKVCSTCLRGECDLQCSACKFVWYCSRDCQRKHWAEHKPECSAIAARKPPPSPEAVLLARTIRRRLRELAGAPAASAWDSFESLIALPSHREQQGSEALARCAPGSAPAWAGVRVEALKRGGGGAGQARGGGGGGGGAARGAGAPGVDPVELLCIFGGNNFTVQDDQLFPVGAAVFPAGALLNHSCEPSCAVLYEGRRQLVRALRDLPAGAELTHSYVDAGLPRERRRADLRARYHFDCACPRCAADPAGAADGRLVSAERSAEAPRRPRPAPGPAPPRPRQPRPGAGGLRGGEYPLPPPPPPLSCSARALRGGGSLTGRGARGAARAGLEAAVRGAEAAGLDPCDVDRWSSHAALMQLCIDAGDWRAAAHHCARTVDAYRELYPALHPLLLLQLFMLGKLRWNAGEAAGAVGPLEEAARGLALVQPASPSLAAACALLRDARREAAA